MRIAVASTAEDEDCVAIHGFEAARFGSVWASGPEDVWIAARLKAINGDTLLAVVLQGDGAHWNEVTLPGQSSTSVVVSIWGTSASDVWLLDSATVRAACPTARPAPMVWKAFKRVKI